MRRAPTGEPYVFQITITKEYLELEPIGMLFIVFFGVVLIIQFVAMLVHRFGTLSHMLSTTQINWFRSGPQVRSSHVTRRLGALRDVACGTRRKVAGSIPNEVIEVFNRPKTPSSNTLLGLTQPNRN
jgi:hypothetical protein